MRLGIAILIFSALALATPASGQVMVGVKFMGLSLHLKKSNHPELYPTKLDKNGRLVFNQGIMLSCEVMVYKNISVKVVQGVLNDCASQFAGFTHIGLRASFTEERHTGSLGVGPTLFYRNSWYKFPCYQDRGLFKQYGNWQYKFIPYGGDIQYDFQLDRQTSWSSSIIPGVPEILVFSSGMQFKFEKPAVPVVK